MYYSVSDTGILGKKSECSYQESNLRPSITSSDTSVLQGLPITRDLLSSKELDKVTFWWTSIKEKSALKLF